MASRKRKPPPERHSEAALRVSRRGTLIANLAGLNLRLKSGWHRKLKWAILALATGGGLAALRRFL